MAKFAGSVGFASTVRTGPGISQEVIIEREYRGDLKRESRNIRAGESVNPDLSTNNSIEIVADAYASQNFAAIRFVEWAGTSWIVTEVTVQRPRLLLRLGGVYNGSRAAPEEP